MDQWDSSLWNTDFVDTASPSSLDATLAPNAHRAAEDASMAALLTYQNNGPGAGTDIATDAATAPDASATKTDFLSRNGYTAPTKAVFTTGPRRSDYATATYDPGAADPSKAPGGALDQQIGTPGNPDNIQPYLSPLSALLTSATRLGQSWIGTLAPRTAPAGSPLAGKGVLMLLIIAGIAIVALKHK